MFTNTASKTISNPPEAGGSKAHQCTLYSGQKIITFPQSCQKRECHEDPLLYVVLQPEVKAEKRVK